MGVRHRVWGRALTAATAVAAIMALCVPMAAAQGATGYQFSGSVWNPRALPVTPAVGSHMLTATTTGHPKGYKALAGYQPATPQWPAAGTSTVPLTRTVAPATTPSAGLSASVRHGVRGVVPNAHLRTERGDGGASPSAAAVLGAVPQAVPVAAPVRAGTLPVWIAPAVAPSHGDRAATASAESPSRVRVQLASHSQTLAAGANGMLLGLSSVAGVQGTGAVQVVVDYSALAKAYGGGYGSRLQLFLVPACALTDPSAQACRTRTALPFTNRAAADQLVATVDLGNAAAASEGRTAAVADTVSGTGTGLVVTSGDSGSQGNYAATSLAPSATWQASGTGAFTYSYPVDVPAGLGGSAPSVAFSYNSQSVDGETSARNSQSSWIGDGWDYDPGFIERSYRSCGSLLDSSGNHVLKGSGDECWGGDNATISFGSISGVLVPTTMDTTVPGIVAQWKLQGDDGTIVQELSGADNGLYQGIYYRVLGTDGSIAYFGADHAPSSTAENAIPQAGTPTDASTNSAWGVPVLHPVSGDPCYSSSTGTASKCSENEGWRWNLDFTVSPTGFVQRYDYSNETNYYDLGGGQVAASNGSGTLTPYIRGGTLTQISYGYQLADELAGRTPSAAVVFSSAQRCQISSSFDCTQAISASNATNWPDVPYDLNCPVGDSTTLPPGSTTVPANVCVTSSPTFWTTTRLDKVTTEVNVAGSGLTAVDTYQLGQVYSDAGGVVDPVTGTTVDPADAGELQAVMWLQSIQHTGDADPADGATSPITLNQISFTGTEIDNRVNDSSPAAPPLYHPRISSIQTETGEDIAVEYNSTPCAGLSLSMANADTNTNSCYPVYWAPPGASLPIADWFNKVTVHSVTASDLTIAGSYTPDQTKIPAGSPPQVSTYTYSGAAWHRDDSALTDDQYRTWDQFRGYRTVTVETGTAPDPITETSTTYLQGMDGDYLANGTQRSVTATDSVGDTVTDSDWLAGIALESDTYTAANGTIDEKTVTPVTGSTVTASSPQTPWTDWNSTDDPPPATEPTLSTLPPLTAHRITGTTSRSYALLKDGVWRESQTVTDYDSDGRPSTVDAIADVTGASASPVEKCTTTSYATAPSSSPMMLSYPDQTVSTTGACGASSSTLLSAQRVYYGGDGTQSDLGTFGEVDSTGLTTGTQIATSASGGTPTAWQTTATMAYDGAGRVVKSLDAMGNVTTSSFIPAWSAAGGNTDPTEEASTNPEEWTTTSYLDPLRGLAIKNVDANGGETDVTYDALGRRTAVWLPGHTQSSYPSQPDETFSYSINPGAVPAPGGTITSPGAPSSVTTDSLLEGGSYATSITIYDGMLQERQTQTSPQGDSNQGRLISDTFYDSHGWPRVTYSTYSDPDDSPSTTLYAADEDQVPAENSTVYDGQGRAIASVLWHDGIEQWQSATSYPGADETDTSQIEGANGNVIPGGGGTATATMTNALGQTTSSVIDNTNAQVGLTGGQVIPSGTSLSSNSVQLAMQAGGNLVLTSLASGSTLWSSGTSTAGSYAEFGTDGNLDVYSPTGVQEWSTGLAAATGSTLTLQDDANLVDYTSTGTVAWSSGTAQKAQPANATTSYTYTPAGQVSTVKDNAGNTWSYQYNLLGQETQQTDPNTGTATMGPYDALGNLEQTTDSRGQILSYHYDSDNREVGEYTGAWSATPNPVDQLTSNTYDTLEKGYPTSSTRYVGGRSGSAYTEAVTGYNSSYQPTGSTLTVPASDGFAPAGATSAPSSGSVTYSVGATYTQNTGLLNTTTYQADGGLPAETVSYGYNQQGDLNGFGSTIGQTTPAYAVQTVHDAFGRVLQTNYQTAASGKQIATYEQYDQTTGALTESDTELQSASTVVDNVNYRYNQAGEITAIDDVQNGGATHDTQCFSYDSMQRLTQAWTDTEGTNSPNTTDPTVGDIGGCTTTSPQTTTADPVTAPTIGGPAPYWQTYSYDLLGDRTTMVDHDTTGNAADDTTQTIGYPGSNGTAPATDPDQASQVADSNPTTGSTTLTPGYTDPTSGADDGDTTTRTVTTVGQLQSAVTTTAGGKLCLADPGASTTPGTGVILWGCGGGGQSATIGNDGTVRIQGLCLDTAGGSPANGTTVVLDTCGSAASQKWKATATALVNTNSGLCLADPSGNQSPGGAKQIVWTCGSGGQTYTVPTDDTAIPAGQTQTTTYDAEGRTSSVTTGTGSSSDTSSYLYDASGNLLEQTSSTGSTPTTRILYLFGGAEQITLNIPSKSWTALRNYSGPDGTTITRTSAGTVAYQIANAQGTAETSIDSGTLAVTRRYYDPYGNPRGAQPSTWVSTDENHGFLGQPTDPNTGLDLLGARDYDPTEGRFTSPDPVFEAGDPNQMGGYTYAADNPSTGSDASGLMRLMPVPLPGGYSGGDPTPTPPPTQAPTNTSSGNTSAAPGLAPNYVYTGSGGQFPWHRLYNYAATAMEWGGAIVAGGSVIGSCLLGSDGLGSIACVEAGTGAAGYVLCNLGACDLQPGIGDDDAPAVSNASDDGQTGALPDPSAGTAPDAPDTTATATITSAQSKAAAEAAAAAELQDGAGPSGAYLDDITKATTDSTTKSTTEPTSPGKGTSGDGDSSTTGTSSSCLACKCSFSPDTPVLLANGTTKPIGKLEDGDQVESADPNTGKEEGGRTVQHIWINHDTDLLDVVVSTGHGHTATIHTTANHPFWDNTTHTWVAAGNLKPGHQLNSTGAQHPTVLATRATPGAANRWNLTVQQLHTYYVLAGTTPVLVHNTSGCGPDNQTFATRSEAKAAAYARAGLPSDAVPDSVWTVGDDVTQRGMPGYRFDSSPGGHGIYEQFETEDGSRLIAEHTNDPNAPFSHFHAGQPKVDPSREGVNFGWDTSSEFERYSPVGGAHHMYYESDE